MALPRSELAASDSAQEREAWQLQLGAVLRMADDLIASPAPGQVFASLAELCVPTLGDACLLSVLEPEMPPVAMFWPELTPDEARPSPSAGSRDSDAIYTPIRGPRGQARDGSSWRRYEGVFTLIWQKGHPEFEHALLVRLLVDRAVALIERERLGVEISVIETRAANYEIALSSNRMIGMALGVLMERYKLSSTQALDLMRRVSQATHRKLRDCADDLVATGEFMLPPGVRLIS
jgi:hypothetical protein